jgi:glycosyltransferase involved in cell wall biosynthesis
MPPKFSIIVPCYRIAARRWLVDECVASIAKQTCTDFELLLVDDGSPDESVAVLQEIVASSPQLAPRARVLALATNAGVCAARNAGIDAALGSYVAFLDFDDLWQSQYLAAMERAIGEDPSRLVLLARTDFLRMMGGRVRVRDGGSVAHLNRLDEAEFGAWHLLNNFPVAMGSAVVVARRLYQDYPDLRFDLLLSRTTAEDVLFGFQLMARRIRPYYVDSPLCVHRRVFEMVSRGYDAFLHVDERQVNDYIAEVAAGPLQRDVLAARPEYADAFAASAARLNLQFDLKREYRSARAVFGLARCLKNPRGFKALLRLHLTRWLHGGVFEFLMREYLFRLGGTDAAAHKRVASLRAGIAVA